LRGGAFKPRTSPYAYQGLGEAGLKILADVRAETGLPVVTEVIDPASVELVSAYADMLQVGTRNMQNFALLQAVGSAAKPVLLKRGMSATIEEWLMAAEYIAQRGNLDIVLCERGIRTFETATRNTLDISAVPVAQRLSHLPVIVDPSHSGGRRDLVLPLTRAAIAVGADGVIIDVHPEPKLALCDGDQALVESDIREIASIAAHLSPLMGRTLTPAPVPGSAPGAERQPSPVAGTGRPAGRIRWWGSVAVMSSFRFSSNIFGLTSRDEFVAMCRRAENYGYDTIFAVDHLGDAAPFQAVVAAAAATERLRVGTLGINVPFWNPALLAREIATADVLTRGRLAVGPGAGPLKWGFGQAG